MVKARLGHVHGFRHTVESQEALEMKAANYIQRALTGKAGWKGRMDEWLTAGKLGLSDSRACLQQLEKCISLDCSSSEFPPIKASLGRMKVLWLFPESWVKITMHIHITPPQNPAKTNKNKQTKNIISAFSPFWTKELLTYKSYIEPAVQILKSAYSFPITLSFFFFIFIKEFLLWFCNLISKHCGREEKWGRGYRYCSSALHSSTHTLWKRAGTKWSSKSP